MASAVAMLSFEEALRQTQAGKRKLLLGNGFSIAWKPKTFEYRALLDAADFSALSVDGAQVFDVLGTADFEEVIQSLRATAVLAALYEGVSGDAVERMRRDAERLKEALADVLARKHPEHPSEVTAEEYARAAAFLGNFERVFSLNYDLLLYWVMMHRNESGAIADDGFRTDHEEPNAQYVTWDTTPVGETQTFYYLHGALHLFDSGTKLQKYTWSRTSVRLIVQVREALRRNAFPLVVTEGTNEEKLTKILHSAYLNHARRSFSRIAGDLVVFGHSLSQNDEHILELIPKGKVERLFVSLRGDPGTPRNQELIARARSLTAQRRHRPGLELQFFDAESAHVWR